MSEEARLARALEWVSRLPLLGETELARLIDVDDSAVRASRRELERRGWIESFMPGTYALQARRLSFVRQEALPDLARAFGLEEGQIQRHLPLGRRDILERIARVEITAWNNRFLAELASLPGPPHLEITDARALPLALTASERWWPPRVDGYGCVRAGGCSASFFLAWDRIAAPDEHRRTAVAAWAKARAVADRWGVGGLPVILLICAAERTAAVFERTLLRLAERSDRRVAVLLTTAAAVATTGPAATIWREPGSASQWPLIERLGWRHEQPPHGARLSADWRAISPAKTEPPLRAWARKAATDLAMSPLEHAAAVAMTTDRDERRLLELVAQYPLATRIELAGFAGLSREATERRLDWLLKCRVIGVEDGVVADACEEQRYLLAQPGLSLLARRAGVPPRRFERLSPIIAVRPGTPPRHREHLLGLHRVLGWFSADARRAGGSLALVRNEAASTRRFRSQGRSAWIRPDGSGVVGVGDDRLSFLLEYDRGTLSRGDFASKLGGYQAYFATDAWRQDFETTPYLLFVCSGDAAERRVVAAVQTGGRGLPVLITSEWRVERNPSNSAGLLGAIWRGARNAERRSLAASSTR